MNYFMVDNRFYSSDELYHHGIKGMKWGVRRYQNTDGTLTNAGKRRMKWHAREAISAKILSEKENELRRTAESKTYAKKALKYDKKAAREGIDNDRREEYKAYADDYRYWSKRASMDASSAKYAQTFYKTKLAELRKNRITAGKDYVASKSTFLGSSDFSVDFMSEPTRSFKIQTYVH